MCSKQKEIYGYEYAVADCGAPIFRRSFDLVIEKGVIDALVGKREDLTRISVLEMYSNMSENPAESWW